MITNEGNEYQNVNWSIMHQSSTIQLMLKRLGLGFMDSRFVTLVLPNISGKTLDRLLEWLDLRERDMEEARMKIERDVIDGKETDLDNFSTTAGELLELDDEEEDLSIEFIRKLPEKDFLEFINAAKYLNIHDLRDFCIEFDERTVSNATDYSYKSMNSSVT